MKLSQYFPFFIVLLLFSCKDPNEYRVASDFAEYLNRFETEAAKRGKNFDLENTGLIIEYADLKNDYIGLTHYETPIRIEIDKTYWNEVSTSADVDELRECLIFHELGHGLLNRGHINTILENGDWKSIMSGGTKVENKTWNINYRGVRRDYYIDELFDESTPEPEFSSKTLLADTTGFSGKVYLSFDDEVHAGWNIETTDNYSTSIQNGRLKFESKVDKTFLVFGNTGIDVQSDFSFDLHIESQTTDPSLRYGIIFGYVPKDSTGATDPIEYFTISNDQFMYMGNRSCRTYFSQLYKESIIINGDNWLKVVKIGDMIYYFINGVYEYCSEMVTKESGSTFGFLVPENGTVFLNDFIISQKSASSGVMSKVKQNTKMEFGVKEINQFIPKNTYKYY